MVEIGMAIEDIFEVEVTDKDVEKSAQFRRLSISSARRKNESVWHNEPFGNPRL